MLILIVFIVVGVFLLVSSINGTGNRKNTNRKRNHYNGDLNNFNYIDSNSDYSSSHHHHHHHNHDSGSDFGGDSGCDGGADCGGGCDGGGSCD